MGAVMSYIEREALRDALYKEDAITMKGVAIINQFPAADVAHVVHGEWVLVGTNEHDYETSVEEKCSLCGRYVYRYDTEPQDNYCPNCGAKMDKEAENERND